MRFAARDGPAAGRDRGRALPAPRGLRPPRRAAVRADEVDARAAEDALRHQRVLPEELARRWRTRSRSGPGACAASLEIAERCNVEIELGRHADPALPVPGRHGGGGLPARARRGGPARALRRPAARRGDRAHGDGARRHRAHGLLRLLPDRLGLHQLREVQRHRRRPGPRLGGRLARRLLPAHHRPRPAALRPAVRALPEPRARVDAGHRHRLLRARPRARDALRDRQVRRRPRRADHHLRQDVPARGDARRGARARLRLRQGRRAGQADPGPDHGPRAELRGVPEAGRGPAPTRSPATRTPSASSTSPRASRASSATRRSTPPRS